MNRLAPFRDPPTGKRLRLGVSACLLGRAVRYDAGHKRDHLLLEAFGPEVEWVPVCPEVECGFGIPRETMELTAGRLVTTGSGRDLTRDLTKWAEKRVEELAREGLCGFVLKSGSPSCAPAGRGREEGLFAKALRTGLPLLPVEDEVRLRRSQVLRDFLRKIDEDRRRSRRPFSRRSNLPTLSRTK